MRPVYGPHSTFFGNPRLVFPYRLTANCDITKVFKRGSAAQKPAGEAMGEVTTFGTAQPAPL